MTAKIGLNDQVLQIINKYGRYGDLSAISKRFYGNNKNRASVKWAILNKAGDPNLIQAIEDFYREREANIEALTDYEQNQL